MHHRVPCFLMQNTSGSGLLLMSIIMLSCETMAVLSSVMGLESFAPMMNGL